MNWLRRRLRDWLFKDLMRTRAEALRVPPVTAPADVAIGPMAVGTWQPRAPEPPNYGPYGHARSGQDRRKA